MLDANGRRNFMKLMGASLALASSRVVAPIGSGAPTLKRGSSDIRSLLLG